MVQQDEGDEYVVATGVTHSVRELVETAFEHVGLDSREYVHIDESLVRGKAELHNLVGDPSKAKRKLGWEPTVTFEGLVQRIVDAELERLRGETPSHRVSEFDRYGGGEYERALETRSRSAARTRGFYNEVKAERLIDLARRVGDPSTLSVLDVGAGIGLMDEH